MTLDVGALESSFEVMQMRGEDMVRTFYDRLFREYPELADLFTHDNSMRLLEGLRFIVANLRNQAVLVRYLNALGRLHDDFGVEPQDYQKVGRILLATLKDFAGDAWSRPVERAWNQAYRAIQAIMLQGADRLTPVAGNPSP